MMRLLSILSLIWLALHVAPGANDLYRFGRLGLQLPPDDITAITEQLAAEGVPWALFGWYSQTLPEVRYVDAFLPPFHSTAVFRRGPIAHLKCSPVEDESACIRWEEAAPAGEYAQVSDDPDGFSESYLPRTPRERPIRILGDLSDGDLISLVAYIRTSPRPPSEESWVTTPVSGDWPILDILPESEGTVRAWLTLDDGVVCSARFTAIPGGWQITEVVFGIA